MHTAELRWLNEEDYLQGELTSQSRTDSRWVVENLAPGDVLRLSGVGLNLTFAEVYEQLDNLHPTDKNCQCLPEIVSPC